MLWISSKDVIWRLNVQLDGFIDFVVKDVGLSWTRRARARMDLESSRRIDGSMDFVLKDDRCSGAGMEWIWRLTVTSNIRTSDF